MVRTHPEQLLLNRISILQKKKMIFMPLPPKCNLQEWFECLLMNVCKTFLLKASIVSFVITMLFGCDFLRFITAPSISDVPPPYSRPVAVFGSKSDFFFGVTAPSFRYETKFDEDALDLAAKSGAQFVSILLEWEKLTPHLPGSSACHGVCTMGVQNPDSLQYYKNFVAKARSRGMQIVVTLFHDSMPKWGNDIGGWTNPVIVPMFEAFSADVIRALAADIDYWITVSNPQEFLLSFKGDHVRGLENIVNAHKKVYALAHKIDTVSTALRAPNPVPVLVGMAYDISANPTFVKFSFVDATINHIDFLGVNYHGPESATGSIVGVQADREYGETARAVDPADMHQLIKEINSRYNVRHEKRVAKDDKFAPIPIIITEIGVADATDILRPAYIVEHLLAIAALRREGAPIRGFIYRDLFDSADSFHSSCPKFGLISVDKQNNFARRERDSFRLFHNVVTSGVVFADQREAAWNLLQNNIGKPRPFCVAADGKTPLDEPTTRNFVKADWRFINPAHVVK